jgi:hypothetical protein
MDGTGQNSKGGNPDPQPQMAHCVYFSFGVNDL